MKRSAAALAARSHWATKRLKQEDDEIEVTAVNELPRLPLLLLNCPSVDANDDTTKVSLILGDEGLRELFQFNFNIDVEFALTLFHDNVLVNQVPITFISGTPGLLMLYCQLFASLSLLKLSPIYRQDSVPIIPR